MEILNFSEILNLLLVLAAAAAVAGFMAGLLGSWGRNNYGPCVVLCFYSFRF